MSVIQLIHSKVAHPKPVPFSLKSAIEHWPSGTDARQDAKKNPTTQSYFMLVDAYIISFASTAYQKLA